jgi:hypothetical protein
MNGSVGEGMKAFGKINEKKTPHRENVTARITPRLLTSRSMIHQFQHFRSDVFFGSFGTFARREASGVGCWLAKTKIRNLQQDHLMVVFGNKHISSAHIAVD